MKQLFFLCIALISGVGVFAQSQRPNSSPNEFVIGRDTFFDFGPPFDYYDLFIVRDVSKGSSVEKISMTPPAGCEVPAKVEMVSTVIQESVADLLSGNPCALKRLYAASRNDARSVSDLVVQKWPCTFNVETPQGLSVQTFWIETSLLKSQILLNTLPRRCN